MDIELQNLFQKNIDYIDMIDKIISYLRAQNYDKAVRTSTTLFNLLESGMVLLQKVVGAERFEALNSILTQLFQAQGCKDYVLQADLYELQLRKYFIDLQEDIISSDGFTIDDTIFQNNYDILNQVNSDLCELIYHGTSPYELAAQGYEVEFSSCGLMTLATTDKLGRYYLHSNGRISDEALALASSWYDEETIGYIVYGFGLGYHIRELMQLDSSISIEVYEADLNILKLAAAYTRLANIISKPNIRLVYDPLHKHLLQRLTKLNQDEKFVVHYPSLRNVRDLAIKEKLENYFVQFSSIANQLKLMNGNFRENILHYNGLADELKEQFMGKNLYIVAAGPSLDKNFSLLKEVNPRTDLILATGTVFRKLLAAGILPDYVIFIDANERVYGHLAGYETHTVPMLYLSTAYKGFAKNYHGKKYIVLQKDYDKAEEYAAEHDSMLFNTGGSVSTTALDIGIAFECKRVIFLGLDLAFTDNFVHATGTSRRELTNTDDLRQIEDINGNLIYTSRNLDMYRRWIENRIREVEQIEFIDATEGGARINGMKIMKMQECIENYSSIAD
jgi:hypothetical protein